MIEKAAGMFGCSGLQGNDEMTYNVWNALNPIRKMLEEADVQLGLQKFVGELAADYGRVHVMRSRDGALTCIANARREKNQVKDCIPRMDFSPSEYSSDIVTKCMRDGKPYFESLVENEANSKIIGPDSLSRLVSPIMWGQQPVGVIDIQFKDKKISEKKIRKACEKFSYVALVLMSNHKHQDLIESILGDIKTFGTIESVDSQLQRDADRFLGTISVGCYQKSSQGDEIDLIVSHGLWPAHLDLNRTKVLVNEKATNLKSAITKDHREFAIKGQSSQIEAGSYLVSSIKHDSEEYLYFFRFAHGFSMLPGYRAIGDYVSCSHASRRAQTISEMFESEVNYAEQGYYNSSLIFDSLQSSRHMCKTASSSIAEEASELLYLYENKKDVKVRDYIEKIIEYNQQLFTELEYMTEFKPPQEDPEYVALNPELNDLRKSFSKRNRSKNISIYVNLRGIKIQCYRRRIRHVFLNLMQNSLDAFGGGKGKLRIEIKAENPAEQNDQYIISYEDNAGGLRPESLRDRRVELYAPETKEIFGRGDVKLQDFDPFDKGVTSKEHGTGYGLYLIRRYLQQQRGNIELLHSGAPGIRFRIRLGKHPMPSDMYY